MSRRPGLSGDPETGAEQVHTPGGMSDPVASGADPDVADVAATDMSAEPSSRQEATQPEFDEGRTGADSEIRDLRDRHLRLAAEFDNYKKRVARERMELSDRAQAGFVARLLEVVDDLERIVAGPNTSADALRSAVEMLDRKLWKELESTGVERVDPAGQPFDPTAHEAVSVVPAPVPAKENTVAATFQPGYRFKGSLVRPARVQVFSARDLH